MVEAEAERQRVPRYWTERGTAHGQWPDLPGMGSRASADTRDPSGMSSSGGDAINTNPDHNDKLWIK